MRPLPIPLSGTTTHQSVMCASETNGAMCLFFALLFWLLDYWDIAGFIRLGADFIFWKPLLETPGPVLLAVGDVPNGPPTLPDTYGNESVITPVPSADSSQTVPFADAVTIARVVGALEARNKEVLIRRENSSSFSDLRQGAVVLIGAFNNEWSLRLTHSLRYSLALDPDQHLIDIKDAKNPSSRNWSWGTNNRAITLGASIALSSRTMR